jgi:hypothetical protein
VSESQTLQAMIVKLREDLRKLENRLSAVSAIAAGGGSTGYTGGDLEVDGWLKVVGDNDENKVLVQDEDGNGVFRIDTVNKLAELADLVLRLKESGAGNWLDIWLQLVEDMAYPGEYNPFFRIDQGFWCNKDVFTQGFLGSTSRIYVTFGATYTPCVPSDVGKMVYRGEDPVGVLSSYDNSLKKWWLIGYYPVYSGESLMIPEGTGAGTTNADWQTQPGGGAIQVGHGLTSPADPSKFVLSSSEFGFDRLYFRKLNGELANIAVADAEIETINGDPPGFGGQVGSDTTLADGTKTVTFPSAFDSVPKIVVSVVDSSGNAYSIKITAKSTTQFSVKVTQTSSVEHKHKIGAIGASGAGAYHSHTIDTENQSQTSGPDMPGGTEDVAADVHTHTVQAHNHGGYTEYSSSYTSSNSAGTPSGSVGAPSATQEVNVPLSDTCPLGHPLCQVTGSYQVYPASGTHTHTFTGDALPTHSHTVASHKHSIPTENQSQTSGPDMPGGTKTVASSTHSHTVQAHNHGGETGGTQIAPYIRALDLRDNNGNSEICGAVLVDSDEPAVDLYTEEDDSSPSLAVDFDWIAIPA